MILDFIFVNHYAQVSNNWHISCLMAKTASWKPSQMPDRSDASCGSCKPALASSPHWKGRLPEVKTRPWLRFILSDNSILISDDIAKNVDDAFVCSHPADAGKRACKQRRRLRCRTDNFA